MTGSYASGFYISFFLDTISTILAVLGQISPLLQFAALVVLSPAIITALIVYAIAVLGILIVVLFVGIPLAILYSILGINS